MLITSKKISACLDQANDIAEKYQSKHLAADDPRRYVDNLLDTCMTYIRKPLVLKKLDIPKEKTSIWGACINEGHQYSICYVKGLNFCWERAVICKEIFHAVIDNPEYWNMDLHKHIEEVSIHFPSADSVPGNSVVAEKLAEIAAMQFLFPFARRAEELAGTNKDNSLALAEKYKIPQVRVEQYLSESYMKVLSQYSK